ITLDNSNTFSVLAFVASAGTLANVTIVDSDAVDLAALTLTGDLTVTAGGNISDSGTLVVPGTTTLVAGTNTAILDDAANNFGTVAVTSASTATLVDVGAIDIGASNVTTLNVTAGGNISDSGTIIASGTTTLVAGANTAILDEVANNFGTVAVTSATTATLVDVDAIDLGASSVTTLNVTAAGAITDSGNLVVSGVSTFTTANAQSITLNNTNTFSTLAFVASAGTLADVTINDSDATDLAALTLTGNLSVTSGGAISDSGVLDITGTASFTASGANIDINNATGNGIGGAVSFTTTGSGDVTFDNGTTAINLGTVSVVGTLAVQSGDAITDSGVITVGGAASFTTDLSGKPITLNSQNAITGAVTFDTTSTGGDVSFDNGTTAINLAAHGSGAIGGDLILQTDAATTISNAVTMNTSGAALSITVDGGNALNVQSTLTTNAGAITLSADDDVIFNATGQLASANGNISVTADDDATSDAGSGGALTMDAATVFNAGSGTITGIADEDITLGQMTTTNATTAAITLNTASGNILDGDTTGANDLTANNGTVAVTTGGGTFGTDANAIEIASAALSTTGIPVTVVTPTSAETLSGTTETVGEASVDQTINVVEDLVNTVGKSNQIVTGNSGSTVSAGIAPLQPGSGPVIVDVYSEQYNLVSTEGIDPLVAPAMNQLNDFWVNEEEEN
ncbi:MAG: hypothetical protein HOB18_03705, partial [Nitrospina sp.]|nr:hypothetical protein [Nitrospina sp.]